MLNIYIHILQMYTYFNTWLLNFNTNCENMLLESGNETRFIGFWIMEKTSNSDLHKSIHI